MTDDREEPTGSEEPEGTLDDPLAERAAAWRLREDSEARAAALLERLRADHDQLLEPLKRLVEGERRRFEEEVEGLKRELAEIGEEARADLAREAERGRKQLLGEAERRKEVLRGQLDTRIEELDRYQEGLLGRLSEEEVKAERRLRDASGLAGTEVAGRERRPGREAADRGEAAGRGPLEPAAGVGGAWKSAARPGLRERLALSPARWPTAYRWAALGALIVLLAGAGYVLVRGTGSTDGEAAAGTAPGAVSGELSSRAAGGASAAELRARALDRLRRGATAAALLAAAAGQPDPAVRDRAAEARLAFLLGSDGLGEAASCALLQQVLADRRVEQGLEPVPVDGRCGAGTQTALAATASVMGCGTGDWQRQAACVINRRFSEGEPPCAASWPLRRPCGWSAAEAASAVATVRRMPEEWRARLDLAAEPRLAADLADRQLAEDEARRLVPLAWAAAAAEAGGPVGAIPAADDLSAEELEAALAYLDRLASGGETGVVEPGGTGG